MREASRVCYRFQREAAAAVFDLKGVTQVNTGTSILFYLRVVRVADSAMALAYH